MTGVIAAIITILTLLFLTGLFFNLPEATLGAIVVHAIWKLLDISEIREMWFVRKSDFWPAGAALIGVLLLGVLQGIVLGVVISLLILIYRASFPNATELGRIDPSQADTFVSLEAFPEATDPPEIVVHRFNADLIFSNADAFAKSVLEMIYRADPPARAVVIDCEVMADMDLTGAARLGELTDELRDRDVDVRLARLHGAARGVADRSGLLVKIGTDNVYLSVASAVDATQASLREAATEVQDPVHGDSPPTDSPKDA